jgi:hypothetical protein
MGFERGYVLSTFRKRKKKETKEQDSLFLALYHGILALKLRRYVNQSNVYSLGDEKKLTISTPQTTN